MLDTTSCDVRVCVAGPVPKVLVALWTALVNGKGLQQEGIFRVSADNLEVCNYAAQQKRYHITSEPFCF